MKYCHNCGNELYDEAIMCPKCGVLQANIEKNKTQDATLKGKVIGFVFDIFYRCDRSCFMFSFRR